MMRPTAVLLDRDGTIIDDVGYIGDPAQVRLLPGAAEAIRRFREAGHLVVVVSNQSGVARGLFGEADLSQVHMRLEELLGVHGAALDGAYYCPYLDGEEATVEAYRRDSELRKPRPGMLLQAARELDLDLSRSWMIGDSPSDVEAGTRAGCRTVLLSPSGTGGGEGETRTQRAATLLEAAEMVEHDMKRDRDNLPRTEMSQEDEVVRLLREIHGQLDRTQREQRQQDFSFLRLFGALLQMFAIVSAIWGTAALLNEQNAQATARLILACFLQLAALSAFGISRFR